MSDIVAVLPVRLDSQRIPRKALVPIDGQPLLWHALRQVEQAECFREIVVACDSPDLLDLAHGWGAKAILTSRKLRNGTERIASIADELQAERMVNVQADMARIDPGVFHALLADWMLTKSDVITPVYRLQKSAELDDANLVKVVRSTGGRALYFSRQPIPHFVGFESSLWHEQTAYWGHIGIYGLTQRALGRYAAASPCEAECAESLEQLRFLDIGVPIHTTVVDSRPLRIDSLEDLAEARAHVAAERAARNAVLTT